MKINLALLKREEMPAFTDMYTGDIVEAYDKTHIAIGAVATEQDYGVEDARVGLILAYLNEDILEINWIYVRPTYRGEGIGSKMLQQVVEAGMKAEAIGAYCVCQDEETGGFLRHMGFEVEESKASSYEATLGDFRDIGNKEISGVVPLKELSRRKMLRVFNNDLISKYADSLAIKVPINPEEFGDASMAYVVQDKVKAVLLIRQSDVIEVAYAFAMKGSEIGLIGLVSRAKNELIKSYEEDTPVYIGGINDASKQLIEKMFKSVQKENMLEAYLVFEKAEEEEVQNA